MKEYAIYPLDLGTLTRPKAQATGIFSAEGTMDVPILSYFVTDGERRILVDCGGTRPEPGRYQPHSQSEAQTPRAQLGRFGVVPEDIDTVIFTHLHWDHAAGILDFPNAKAYAQEKELHYAIAPLPIHKAAFDIKVLAQTNYEILYGDTDELLDGISTILTPGHTNGMQSVIINTKAGKYVIASDLVNLFQCWDSDPQIPNGFHVSNEECYNSFRRLKKTGGTILPGHDPKVLEHHCFPDMKI